MNISLVITKTNRGGVMDNLVQVICVSVLFVMSLLYFVLILKYKKCERLMVFAVLFLLIVSTLTLCLEISRIFTSFGYNNLHLADLVGLYATLLLTSSIMLTTSRDVSTILIKDTLSMFFATLTIIFGLLLQIMRQVGNFSGELLIAETVFSVLTIIVLTYGTIMERILLNCVIEGGVNSRYIRDYGKNALIVRTVKVGNRQYLVKILRRDKSHIRKVNGVKFVFAIIVTLIILLI